MRIKFLTSPLLTALLLIPTLASAQERFPGIEQLMTEQELEASGANDLSRREIEALNTWLIRYTANDAPVLQAENEEVLEVVSQGKSIGVRRVTQ